MKQIQYFQTGPKARELDSQSIQQYNIPSLILMEQAAIESAKIIKQQISSHQKICVLCGPENNGGDGLAIVRNLLKDDIQCDVYIPNIDKMSHDEQIQYHALSYYSLTYIDETHNFDEYDVIIDCLFGNGLSRNITGVYKKIINKVNQSNAYVISIDLPSGIEATTGKKLGCAIKANLTIALDCFKEGHFINDGYIYSGKCVCVDIGIPHSLHTQYIINEALVTKLLPQRNDNSHKGTFKKALMIGGSLSMQGALCLSAKACYRSGIGTLTVMIPDVIYPVIAGKMDFAMTICRNSLNGYFSNAQDMELEPYQIIAIGNGMGRNKTTIEMVHKILETDKPVILDADALWAIQNHEEWLNRNAPTILLPHIKEMTYLTSYSVSQILEDPFRIIKEFSNVHKNCITLLKSNISIVGYQDELYVLNQANSALAKGGSGDILCGIVTGLCGQTNNYISAVVSACYVHNQSANLDLDCASVMPDDCINNISNVLMTLRKKVL
ncbi:MAG: NAD(P)H-hydrate dehydratase [Erysipelotrichaceae bacterium]|uniref:NAD(P)H-hydrate dehydratase n=1 Tax=Floccifex sp. TaxID=2815810 RepID=UPI002A752FB7|nr:NAD(P)H-hydrate dehydratase [Floccifex sp.]MDD7281835.1 NAD(P)H-hydrate dehydratase [Erysipelotrichaceae bacterium]MDY2958520.1 NAD(P)H-hydrate dehydratase [Floccifex sp.]